MKRLNRYTTLPVLLDMLKRKKLRGHCQVEESSVDRPPRYCDRAHREPDLRCHSLQILHQLDNAGWMYRAGLESILGLRRRGATFVVDPCISSSWPEYHIVWRFLDTRYQITVSNPTRRCKGVGKATVDGAPVNPVAIPLVDDGRIHDVQIVLGDVTQLDPGLLAGRASARAPHAR